MPTAEKRRRMQELAAQRAAAAKADDVALNAEEEAGLEEGLVDLAAGRVTDGRVTEAPATFTYEQMEQACTRSYIDGVTTNIASAPVRSGDTVLVRYTDGNADSVIANAEAIAAAIRNGRDDVAVLFMHADVTLERYDEAEMERHGWARMAQTRVMTPAMLGTARIAS